MLKFFFIFTTKYVKYNNYQIHYDHFLVAHITIHPGLFFRGFLKSIVEGWVYS